VPLTPMKRLRLERDLTLKELAQRTAISVWSLSMYEAEKQIPSVRRAQRIAEALGVPVEQVFPPKEVSA